jgi:phosphoribosylaminoimidazolecarboxamide formyltransferase/IMP cyclohydrolase
VSTGSTAAGCGRRRAGDAVDELTGFPECLDGRVKTLHPHVHAGILADLRITDHIAQLEQLGIEPFELVVVNLYPFAATVASGATPDECVEQIDIGGPTMVRAAAKNHPSVAVVVSPASYDEVLEAVVAGGTTLEQRQALAVQAFRHTASYDIAVASWMGNVLAPDGDPWPGWAAASWTRADVLRYGENPHQAARSTSRSTAAGGARRRAAAARQADVLQQLRRHRRGAAGGVRLRRPRAWRSSSTPTPCGIAVGRDVAEAHRKAHACDPVSAFGGVIAVNRPVSVAMAEQVAEIFTEVVVAPGVRGRCGRGARRASRRSGCWSRRTCRPVRARRRGRSAGGAAHAVRRRLHRHRRPVDVDARVRRGACPRCWPTWRSPGGRAAVKSNAILLALGRRDRRGRHGAGQPGRRGPAGRARAGERAAGRSPPPTRSSRSRRLQVLLDAGVRAVVQPGGSVRDEEVVAARGRRRDAVPHRHPPLRALPTCRTSPRGARRDAPSPASARRRRLQRGRDSPASSSRTAT